MRESYFSKTYAEARQRFKAAATAVGATISSYRIDAQCPDELTIDVAIIGPDDAPALLISSGVHGVEGFFGSAVQLAFLEQLRQGRSTPHIRYVLIHALNPFGFSQLRRFNEDNVDLNRNFLINGSDYQGAPAGYAKLNTLLNPESSPSRFEPFKLIAIGPILRHGLQSLKQAVAGGQYEYPRGIFFGGHKPSQSAQVVYENCEAWIGFAAKIVHIDFHTGLGAFGSYKLLLTEGGDSDSLPWYNATFGADYVEVVGEVDATAYKVSGIVGEWLQAHFKGREYRFVAAEFGTYNVLRVLGAIRAENRAHHYANKNSLSYQWAKAELLECFCPSDQAWREQVLESGLKVIAQAVQALTVEPSAR